MVFDNCEKYIENEILSIRTWERWKEKTIILYGLDSLAKTVFQIFCKHKIHTIIIDENTRTMKWANQIVKNSIEFEVFSDNTEFIVSTNQSKEKLYKVLDTAKLEGKYIVHDLSYIRMNKMPNPIIPTRYLKTINLRECQLLQLEVMDYFDDFCKKNNLRYFLDYGSLIGAIRHKGFIPWDDDVDVAMPMPDYLRLCEIFPRDGEMFFDSMYNEKVSDFTPSTLTKIKSKKMVVEYNHFPLRTYTGIGIDIFPLCGYPKEKDEQLAYMQEFINLVDKWKEIVVIPYGTELYSKDKHVNLFNQMCELALLYDYESAEVIGPAYFGYDTYPAKDGGRAMPKSWYAKALEMDFEGRKYTVPVGYDNVLKKWYGDYMELPPESERTAIHSGIIYKVEDFAKYE